VHNSALEAALPHRVPRGVSTSLASLLALRRYGPAMRRTLELDELPRLEGRPQAARTQGMEYAESRTYSPGDDVRRFDWRVTARTGRAHTKVFRLERGNDLFCLIDQRRSMRFGTRAAFKSVVAAELAALAGWAAVAGGDRFGAIIAGTPDASIRLAPAQSSVPMLCSAIAATSFAADDASGSESPLDLLAARAADQAAFGTCFLIASDFAEPETVFTRAIGFLRAKGPLVLAWILDPVEEQLPPSGRYPITDGRTHLVLDTSPPAVRWAHARELAERRRRLERLAAEPATRCLIVRTGDELFSALGRRFVSSSAS